MAFKMKGNPMQRNFPGVFKKNNNNDDDVLSKEIKDTRELSDEAQEKSRRGGIGPEESPEVIAKKEGELKKSIDTASDKKSIDIANKKAAEYDEAYRYKKEPSTIKVAIKK